jgi:hypothetical protein
MLTAVVADISDQQLRAMCGRLRIGKENLHVADTGKSHHTLSMHAYGVDLEHSLQGKIHSANRRPVWDAPREAQHIKVGSR